MFSYCNRNNSVVNTNTDIYQYSTNDYNTNAHNPWICNGTYQQQKQNRGVPSNLIDASSKLRGQGAEYQCLNDTKEIQFSTLRPKPIFERTGNGGVPCMTVTSYTNEVINKGEDRNVSRPVYGHPDVKYSNSDKL